jgi:hypothetical protein
MDTPPPVPPAPGKPRESFGHQAAKFSLYAPIVALALGCVLNGALSKPSDDPSAGTTRLALAAINLMLIIAGTILGVVALASMRKHGTRGILVRSIVGLFLNVGLLAMMASVFLFNPVAGATSRIVGDWAGTLQPKGRQMDLHLAKDMSAQCIIHGEHPRSIAAHWAVLRDKDPAAPYWLILQIDAKDSPDGKAVNIKWKITHIEPDTLSLEGEHPETYARIKP